MGDWLVVYPASPTSVNLCNDTELLFAARDEALRLVKKAQHAIRAVAEVRSLARFVAPLRRVARHLVAPAGGAHQVFVGG